MLVEALSIQSMEIFRVRLNCVDHYQATPLDFDPALPKTTGDAGPHLRPRVPVIRVFGSTETGQKVCAHVHGAFPYLYIPYPKNLTFDDAESYIHQLHLSIDHALAVSYRRNTYDGNNHFVAHITLAKGIPFYGFHVGFEIFLKIYLLNPLHMTRLADLLRQGAIMKQIIQPYESHLQYLAQWMCDYNLYGCAYIDCKEVKFRLPVPEYLDVIGTRHRWHDRSIPEQFMSDGDQIQRQSHCALEVDVCVQDILNRSEVKPRDIHHAFVERTLVSDPKEKLVNSMASLWRDETRRRKARMGIVDSDSSPFPPEVLVSVSADPRNSQPGGWIHEEEFRDRVRLIIDGEKGKAKPSKVTFDDFPSQPSFEDQVSTLLESVQDLFPENLNTANKQLSEFTSAINEPDGPRLEVDEDRVLSFQEDDFPYESDEELARELERSQKKRYPDTEQPKNNSADHMGPDSMRKIGSSREEPNGRSLDATKQGPTSSDELADLGIRDAGDYTHADYDAFEIPREFSSDVLKARQNYETRELAGRRKRRKVSYGGLLNGVSRQAEAGNTEPKLNGLHEENNDSVTSSPIEMQKKVFQDFDGQSQQSVLSSSSKDPIRTPGSARLSFPVVKDPQDPTTIWKLSQKSNSSFKASQSADKTPDSRTVSEKLNLDQSELRSRSTSTSSKTLGSLPSSATTISAAQIHSSFSIPARQKILCIAKSSPASQDVVSDVQKQNVPTKIYQDAFYSNQQDVPERAREYAGREFKLESLTVPYLPDFDASGRSSASVGQKPSVVIDRVAQNKSYERRKHGCSLRTWEIAELPPSFSEVQGWLENDVSKPAVQVEVKKVGELSQIDGMTQKNRHGFKYSQKQKSTSVQHETQYMSIMSLEVHVNTRGSLMPNPEQDEVSCVFWCIQSDGDPVPDSSLLEGKQAGIIALSEESGLAQKISQFASVDVEEETSELDLINRTIDLVRNFDPDILTGYEVHGSSWGYMIERARVKYDYNLCDEFSRMKSQSHGRFGKEEDRWGFNMTSTIRVTGRHMINVWRAMRGELNLLQYTMENVAFQLCHKRVPHYSFHDLTTWYKSGKGKDMAKVIDYYLRRVQIDLEILEKNELIPRTSEQARLLGVDFFSVFSRGSQFKVESLMFRIAKPENLLLPSPSRKQVGQQNALECLPLVMEPQSAFYNSPLLVLDFQSLYPSVMIAYNYCYSTFLGRIVNWRGQNKMGFTDYHRQPGLLELLKDQINIAPNGIMYAKPEIRKSLLAKMLGEILETRVMVKSGMKIDKDDKTLQRLLNNRQLALKLIANVTYGYTSASFSGRMPCSEIADSIVQTGRETLEKAIALIHSVSRWNAEVVYGDTDSLFVYLKGRTKDEAFDIGQEIAKAVTDMNPRPVKLKFEKVYLPCVLLAKKRYVGFKYETKSQKVPEFDAKGIETVRRDGTPAEQKIEEKALKLLFRTADLSQVKSFFQRQCTKIMRGRVSIQDFCFAREVKLGTYSDKGLPPPGALISTRRMLKDPRAEPQYGERVPYVVVTGAPGARLIDRCVAPDVLLMNDDNELDAEYYISKNIIPPLERIFNLVGANVRQWYDEMPKFQRMRRVDASLHTTEKDTAVSRKTMESYMKASTCVVCCDKLEGSAVICNRCTTNADTSTLILQSRLGEKEKKARSLERVCQSCAGLAWNETVKCDSKDCAVFFTRMRHSAVSRSDVATTLPIISLLNNLDGKTTEW